MKKLVFGALALALTSCLAAHAADRPMRILLVNDDGCKAPGIIALKDKLTAKGYEVWSSGPATNQSGIGTAITYKPGKTFSIEKLSDRTYCFPGTPSDALLFGLYGLLKDTPPDLVISGVNDGPNVGIAQFNSGTVGAAARAVREGIPAIAASVGVRLEEAGTGYKSSHEYVPVVADYVVEIVDHLNSQWKPGQSVLPAKSGFSINYPPYPKAELKGIRYVENEFNPIPQIVYQDITDTQATQVSNPMSLKPATRDNDAKALESKYIVYTLFDGDWNASQFQTQYEKVLGKYGK